MSSQQEKTATVAHITDYLWWLMPYFLKKKERKESLIGKLWDSWGLEFEELRATINEIIPLMLAYTATGTYLDRIGRSRQTSRLVGESDESYRVRVLGAMAIKTKAGTIPGMEAGLLSLGYTVEVLEPNNGTSKWSRFVVKITGWDGVVASQAIFYQVVNLLRPAHTRALIDAQLTVGTLDDWELGEDELTLDDDGQLDDWHIT